MFALSSIQIHLILFVIFNEESQSRQKLIECESVDSSGSPSARCRRPLAFGRSPAPAPASDSASVFPPPAPAFSPDAPLEVDATLSNAICGHVYELSLSDDANPMPDIGSRRSPICRSADVLRVGARQTLSDDSPLESRLSRLLVLASRAQGTISVVGTCSAFRFALRFCW